VRVRILVWYVLLLALALLVSALVVRHVLLSDVTRRIDSELTESAGAMAALASPKPGEHETYASLPALLRAGVRNGVPEQNSAVIALRNGHVFAVSQGSVPLQLEQDRALIQSWAATRTQAMGTVDTNAGEVRYAAVPVSLPGQPGSAVLVTAIFASQDRTAVLRAVDLMIETMLLALLVASVLAWFAAGRLLRPVRSLTGLARTISDSDLTRRIPVHGDDEISELARTFNAMLDRLDFAFQTQRAFVDDAGHELRTPITIIRGHLELLGDDADERAETVGVVTEELDRMARQVDDLLMLAKAAQPAFLTLATVDVHELTNRVFAKSRALGDRDWCVDNHAQGRAVLDQQRVTQAMVQLATNAVQHTTDGDRIQIGSRLDQDTVSFWVRDWGPGVDPADQERIFGRFARSAQPRSPGSGAGLGLAIVRSIAQAHHGKVGLQSRPGHGATFTVTLPMDQPLSTTEDRS
jgi:two-component system, OmpR family, sensor kinase